MKQLVLSKIVWLFCAVLLTLTIATPVDAQVWEQTNGPAGGYIDEIHAGPDSYVYTMSNGLLFRSSNSGDNWEQIETVNEIMSLVGVDDNGYVFAADTSNLLRSTDYGENWSPVFTTEYSPAFNLLSAPGDTVYCYGPLILMSVDNGQSWTVIDSTWSYNVVINSSGDLIKEENNQLLISTDQGGTWNLLIDLDFLNTEVTAMDINQQDEIFLGGSWTGIYRVAADGSSWVLLEDAFYDIYDIEVTSSGTVYCISYLGYLSVSYDNGENWAGTHDGMVSFVTYYSLTSNPSGTVFVGWHDGIYKSINDGISWLLSNSGINHSSVKELVTVPGEGVFALTDNLVWKSENQGETWSSTFGTNPNQAIDKLINLPAGDLYLIVEDLFIDKRAMIPCFNNYCEHLMRSEDGGETWNEVLSAAYMSDVVMNSTGDLFVSMGDELMKSEDDGSSWEVINLQVHLSNLAVDTADMLYGQSSYGFYISDDEGLNWDSISPPAYDGLQFIFDLQISNSGVLYSTSSTGSTTFLHVSSDGGISWEEVTPADSLSITQLYIGMYDFVYLSSDSGIFRSQNNGQDWTNISYNLATNYSLAVTEDETGVLYADVTGHGVFKSGLFVDVKPVSLISDALMIFPNPATETLNVNYGNAFNGTPVFYIYNIHGKLVQSAPIMSITSVLDISSLIPGFYTIEIQGKTAKFVVAR